MTGRPSSANGKRDNPDSSSNGANYASNMRIRAKKRLDQLRKEMDEATEKHVAVERTVRRFSPPRRENGRRERCSVARKLLRQMREDTKSSS
ncbi:hypothetical protein PF008_g18204 [Phytophthora fragariae]|uniref:Uncharacterized protein n=1 Tax=Phytophthora fragariae TaxID=53985 RepID=A0A6G0R6S9_9STRA|nr:hypothetical protein PF008_g18204 [Phytophthora fragariae]